LISILDRISGRPPNNGYLPFAAPVPLIAKRWDVNITIFSVLSVLLIGGALSILGAHAG